MGDDRHAEAGRSSSNLFASLKQSQQRARQEEESRATEKLLSEAKELLAAVDDAHVFHDKEPRRYPTFEQCGVVTGPLLGVGGFGVVLEVNDIHLQKEGLPITAEDERNDDANDHVVDQKNQHTLENFASAMAAAGSGSRTTTQPVKSSSSTTTTTTTTMTTLLAFNDDIRRVATAVRPNHHPSSMLLLADAVHSQHYDIKTARDHIAEHVQRNGDARYAVKRLHPNLSDLSRARGMIDLAIEAKFLSVVWHPNIIKMRAVATRTMLSPQFFIVMDRLCEILPARIKQWSELTKKWGGTLGLIGGNKLEMKQLLVERMVFCYDLASAFWYMHENKLVYRDMKQENIGFDIRGDVKIFDFGLCKGLSPALKNKDGPGYNLTFRTGTVPYMAPEVAECKPYDCKCDVFSFAILLWEMLSLKKAFKGVSPREYMERVVRRKERPHIKRSWPPLTRVMIQEAWEYDPNKRPDMKRIAVLIRGDLNEMTTDPNVQERTEHMRERSAHSIRLARSFNAYKQAAAAAEVVMTLDVVAAAEVDAARSFNSCKAAAAAAEVVKSEELEVEA